MDIRLSPTQTESYEWLQRAVSCGHVILLRGKEGRGRTTLLRNLQQDRGGALLTMKEYTEALSRSHPFTLEEVFERLMLEAMAAHEIVILDDLHLLTQVTAPCGLSFYPRKELLHACLTTLATHAMENGKKLVMGTGGTCPDPLRHRAFTHSIGDFTKEDYAFFARLHLGAAAEGLDFAHLYRFAPELNAHQIKNACLWLKEESPDTQRFTEYLRSQQMRSNVDLGEVQAVELHDLKGCDDILRSLEANIIIPLENDALAEELNIKPKRGVLLAGPPGTGKTTVGRALAHRLKSKFFMIDGTFISGTEDFYGKIHLVFETAKQNAPSIIFIDDSDVIFENSGESGLYRYLLTVLDGLESETAGRVCVMMTAMDVSNLPPALVRSGRIELWLETRLPDAEARREILNGLFRELPPVMGPVDARAVAEASEELTGADLKRLVEDGKLLYAYDRATGQPSGDATGYFLRAIDTVRENKEKYAEAEAAARERHPSCPSIFDMYPMDDDSD